MFYYKLQWKILFGKKALLFKKKENGTNISKYRNMYFTDHHT